MLKSTHSLTQCFRSLFIIIHLAVYKYFPTYGTLILILLPPNLEGQKGGSVEKRWATIKQKTIIDSIKQGERVLQNSKGSENDTLSMASEIAKFLNVGSSFNALSGTAHRAARDYGFWISPSTSWLHGVTIETALRAFLPLRGCSL